MENKYDIFISYSRRDSETVLPVVKNLESEGYTVWIDVYGIESNEQFKEKIVSVIENSTVMIFFSSKDSNNSSYTAKEIGIAISRQKPIIPIKLDNTRYNRSVEFDLININFLDYAASPQITMEKLLQTLEKYCGKSKQQLEEERQLRLKQAKLQLKYDMLQEQIQQLCSMRAALLEEMRACGMDVAGPCGGEETPVFPATPQPEIPSKNSVLPTGGTPAQNNVWIKFIIGGQEQELIKIRGIGDSLPFTQELSPRATLSKGALKEQRFNIILELYVGKDLKNAKKSVLQQVIDNDKGRWFANIALLGLPIIFNGEYDTTVEIPVTIVVKEDYTLDINGHIMFNDGKDVPTEKLKKYGNCIEITTSQFEVVS